MAKIKIKAKDKGKRSFIVWMTVIGILLVGSYAAVLGWKSKPTKSPHPPFDKGGQGGILAEVVDPVCGMKVKPPAVGHIEYRAKHYYFCSVSCREDFEKDPRKYTEGNDKKEMK